MSKSKAKAKTKTTAKTKVSKNQAAYEPTKVALAVACLAATSLVLLAVVAVTSLQS